MYLEKPELLIIWNGVKLKHQMNTIKMYNLRKEHKTAVLENSYLRELHASHHCNEQKWLSQQKQVEQAAKPT